MKKIQMVDLSEQYKAIKSSVDKAIMDVVSSAQFINGPDVKSFQQELATYLGVKHVITCANGTDALQISMMGLGLKPGDEVITPSYTYIATTEVIGLLGLKPVFVDCEPDTFNISVSAIEKAITSKTKAIVPVHLYGQACDMQPIMQIAKKHNLFVIEDNAQAIGCDYSMNGTLMKTGTIGNVGCTSFFPSKNLGCYGDGGAICTNDDDLAIQLRMIANHGQSKRYYHDRVGCNSRLDSIQAAVLRIKLKELDRYILRRNTAADFYDAAFENIEQLTIPYRANNTNHVFHQYTLKLSDEINRDDLVAYLAQKDIPAMIYYPVPAHKQKMFYDIDNKCGNLENTNWLTSRVFSLPMHTELSIEQQQYIVESVIEFINK
ncbi:MAG: transcriptional regulator [Crocinitomicaceae bacterium]|nr:transcriptional regulator [Crocinitomicaceae bacterium]